MRPIIALDPGHGGDTHMGKSSPTGELAPSGVPEKVLCLRLGRRIAELLNPHVDVVLTRTKDHNLSLSQRAELAKTRGASAYVSLHAYGGSEDRRGIELWTHHQGDDGARRLADSLSQGLGAQGVRRGQGDLAGIHPTTLGGIPACLLEADLLSDVRHDDCSTTHAKIGGIAESVARGLAEFTGVPRFGGAPQSTPTELDDLLSYLGVTWAEFAPHESRYMAELTRLLGLHSITKPGGANYDRSDFAAAVEQFQTAQSLTVDGTPGANTLWALQENAARTANIERVRVAADMAPPAGGYDFFRLHPRLVDAYTALRNEVLAAGGVITSAGASRSTSATVTSGRSSKSLHYASLAFDLSTESGMYSTNRRYLIERRGTRHWHVWCKSDTGTSRSIDAIVWANKAIRTETVTEKVIDFTAMAQRHGFTPIGQRSSFPEKYLSAEWWHFQYEAALVPYISQFGIEVLSKKRHSEQDMRDGGLWANRKKIWKKDWF